MLLWVLLGVNPKQADQIIRGNIQLFGDGFYGWNAFFQKISAAEILRKRFFKLLQQFVAGLFPSKKLPFIKTFGVDQEQFELGNNQFLGKFIGIVLVFLFNIPEKIDNDFLFLIRQKQCFIDLLAEKLVRPNFFD